MDTKRLFLFIFLGIFLISFVSSAEWDNTGTYDEETQTMFIRNALGLPNWLGGSTLAEMKLIWGDTDVGVGIDTHVGTFSLISYSNVTEDIFNELDLVNLKNGQVMTRGKQYKVKVIVEEDNYTTICDDLFTQTNGEQNSNCIQEENGKINVTEWIPISNPHFNFEKGVLYEIGVFVDTEDKDYGDWIPKIMGVEVPQWASWSASLLSGVTNVYVFDETSGDVLDYEGNQDGTVDANYNVGNQPTNLLGAMGFVRSDDDEVTFGSDISGDTSVTVMGWFKTSDTSTSTSRTVMTMNANLGADTGFSFGFQAGKTNILIGGVAWGSGTSTSETDGNWHSYMMTRNGNAYNLYIDGSSSATATLTNSGGTFGSSNIIGGNTQTLHYTGDVSQTAIFNSVKTNADFVEYHNSGDGLNFLDDTDNPPEISNPLPANNTVYTTTTTVNFNWTATDDINLESTAIYIDGVLENNNTSPTNNSLQTYQKSLSAGLHNWSVIAFDNSSQNTSSDIMFVNISIIPPTIELSIPADMSYTNNENVTFYAYVYDNLGIANVSLYINGSLVETNTDGTNATNYSFTQTLVGGVHQWYIKAIDSDGFESDSATRTINVDLDPVQINATVLTPIIYNYGDIVQVNVTAVDLFLQECWYEYNSITTFFNCTTEIPQIVNVTSVAGQTQINFSANHSVGDVASEVVNFTYDTVVPSVNVTFPIDYSEYGYENLEFNVSFTVNDTNLDSCWAEYPIGNAISGFDCTNTTFTINVANYSDSVRIYANDTLGNQNNFTRPINFYVYNINSTADATVIIGQTAEFTSQNYWDSSNFGSINAYVNWNGIRKPLASKTGSGDYVNFTSSFLISGLTEDTNVTVYWEYFIDGEYHNSTSFIQETQTLEIDNCSTYSYTVVNLTLKDEELNQIINATNESALIEVDLFINSNGDEILQYSNTFNLINPASVCSEIDLTGRGFNYDLDVGFSSTDRVQEFYFVDNRLVESQNIPANISLMDLKSVDSTSFLFNYYGADGLPVEDSLVHTYRKYIGDGLFREVEVSRSDQNGDTIVHLVEEDVIYYFEITQNDVSIFNSSEYTALCQATPCTVVINAVGTSSQFPTDWDLIDDGAYLISSSPSTRTVTLDYATDGLSTFDLTVYKYDNDGTYTEVNSTTSTDTSGSLSIYVPQTAGNYSFFASVDKDSEFVNSEWVDMATDPRDVFGVTLSLFLGALIILTLGLFAISEGTGTLVYVLLGVFLSGALGLVTLELASGINILAYLIVAGGIYLWKLTRGRN